MVRGCRILLSGCLMALIVMSSSARADKESPEALASSDGAGLDDRQIALLSNNCVQCHAHPGIGVPLMGNPADWVERNKQGEEKMLANVIYGLRGMPPLGYCSGCNEKDFRQMIRIMTGLVRGAK